MDFWNWPNEGSPGEKICHMGKINEMGRSGLEGNGAERE